MDDVGSASVGTGVGSGYLPRMAVRASAPGAPIVRFGFDVSKRVPAATFRISSLAADGAEALPDVGTSVAVRAAAQIDSFTEPNILALCSHSRIAFTAQSCRNAA